MTYGIKPPRPTSARQVTAYLRKVLRLRKVRLVDMGRGQEYKFAGGMADRWSDPWVTGITQLKQLTFDQWVNVFKALRIWNEGDR
jgi:hypothetical protein